MLWQILNYNFMSQLSIYFFSLIVILYPWFKNLSMPPTFRYKDGVPINNNSTCYKMSGFNLIITDVEQKHAGVFTISLGNQVKGLSRNLSYTLVVDGKLLP